ncbi:MAG: hypothetical protein ACTH3E_00620 [Psychroflexus halocasei]
MAYLDKNNMIRGKIGNIVLRKLNDKIVAQEKSTSQNQTQPTKESATDFGTASTTAKKLTISLENIYFNHHDNTMHTRLRSCILSMFKKNISTPRGQKNLWNSNSEMLNGFDFNINSLLSDYLKSEVKVKISDDDHVKIQVASFDPKKYIKWPESIFKAELCFLVSVFEKDDLRIKNQEVFKKEISFFNSSVTALNYSSTPITSDALVIVSACLLFYKEDSLVSRIPINHKSMHPAQIIKVMKIELPA